MARGLMARFRRPAFALVAAGLLAGCGGGGGDDGGDDVADTATITGRFLDAAVEGLSYHTAHWEGITDANGQFTCDAGETIHFSVGNIALGSATAKEILTPVDLVAGATDELHPWVVNRTRFLMSLDRDGAPENGITLSDAAHEAAVGRTIDFDRTVADFASDPALSSFLEVLNAKETGCGSVHHALVSEESAHDHLRRTLANLSASADHDGGDGDSDSGGSSGGG